MLISVTEIYRQNAATAIAKLLNQNYIMPIELQTGVYIIGHFGCSSLLGSDFNEYPILKIGPYGVCDKIDDIFSAAPEIQDDTNRKFVITLTEVRKDHQPSDGGWRWHKWGEYIGSKNPQREYLYDEDDTIQSVYCFHIYEKR